MLMIILGFWFTTFFKRIFALWRPGFYKITCNWIHWSASTWLFCKWSELSTHNFQLYIDNQPIEKVSTFRYLGVWLSHTLSWSAHVEKSFKAALKQAGMIFGRVYQYCSTDCLEQLYLSFVRPHLEYAVYTSVGSTLHLSYPSTGKGAEICA